MLLSLLGESGVAGASPASALPAASGVAGVLAGRLLDLRWRDSRMGGLSPLLRGILGVTRSSCARQTVHVSIVTLTKVVSDVLFNLYTDGHCSGSNGAAPNNS